MIGYIYKYTNIDKLSESPSIIVCLIINRDKKAEFSQIFLKIFNKYNSKYMSLKILIFRILNNM